MKAAEARALMILALRKKFMQKTSLKAFNFFQKMYITYVCGKINKEIEKSAKKGNTSVRVFFDNSDIKYIPFIINCYEEDGYRVCHNSEWHEGNLVNCLFITWNNKEKLPLFIYAWQIGKTHYYTGCEVQE